MICWWHEVNELQHRIASGIMPHFHGDALHTQGTQMSELVQATLSEFDHHALALIPATSNRDA